MPNETDTITGKTIVQRTMDEVLAAARPLEHAARICLDGSLVADHEALTFRLSDVTRKKAALEREIEAKGATFYRADTTMAALEAEIAGLEAEMDAVRDRMLKSVQVFRMQRLPAWTDPDTQRRYDAGTAAYLALTAYHRRGTEQERHPKTGEPLTNPDGSPMMALDDTYVPELISRCAVDPVMTFDQAVKLLALVGDSGLLELHTAATRASTAPVSVPFSRLRSRSPSPPTSSPASEPPEPPA